MGSPDHAAFSGAGRRFASGGTQSTGGPGTAMPCGAGFQGGQRSVRGLSPFPLAGPCPGHHGRNLREMGILNLIIRRSSQTGLVRLPTGSFTLDPTGRIVASTLPRSFPAAQVREIGDLVLSTFQLAREAHIPLTELIADYAALKLTARELRGGAIIFLAPRSMGPK